MKAVREINNVPHGILNMEWDDFSQLTKEENPEHFTMFIIVCERVCSSSNDKYKIFYIFTSVK